MTDETDDEVRVRLERGRVVANGEVCEFMRVGRPPILKVECVLKLGDPESFDPPTIVRGTD